MFIAELALPNFADFDLKSLRTGIMAGAPCPVEVMRKVQSVMNMREVAIGYGMTETSPVSTQTRIGTPLDKQVSTVGQVHPHVEIKVVDAETGATVPRGTLGEFCTRGYSVMLGYWNNAAATESSIDSAHWMHTGDLAVMDDEGYVNIVGRIKDMIIRGGENVYPREIEEFLYRHPSIKEVQVIGVPDPKFGEELMAWIQLKEGDHADGGRREGVLPGSDRALQGAALCEVRRCVSDDGHRQDSEVRDAPDEHRRTRAGARRKDRLSRTPGRCRPTC